MYITPSFFCFLTVLDGSNGAAVEACQTHIAFILCPDGDTGCHFNAATGTDFFTQATADAGISHIKRFCFQCAHVKSWAHYAAEDAGKFTSFHTEEIAPAQLYSAEDIIQRDGFMVKAFPISEMGAITRTTFEGDIVDVSDTFKFAFENAGYMHNGTVYTAKVVEQEAEPITLGQILQKNVDERFYITTEKMPKWTYLKGAKKIPRKSADGHEYIFSEGPIAFPDPWDRPGRTMLTSESTLNRSTHVVSDPATGRLRLLTPVEAERLQGFDDEWTNSGMPDRMRYFCMGNALVVPMITRMGNVLDTIIEQEK